MNVVSIVKRVRHRRSSPMYTEIRNIQDGLDDYMDNKDVGKIVFAWTCFYHDCDMALEEHEAMGLEQYFTENEEKVENTP